MDESDSRPTSTRRWVGSIIVDGRHYPTSIAYTTVGQSATVEVSALADEDAATVATDRRAAFDVPLSAPVSTVLPRLVQGITGGRAASSLGVSVGALVPAHHDCHAVVVEFASEPRALDGPRLYAAAIRIAGGPAAERFAWTAATPLGEWLAHLDAFCRRRPTALRRDTALATCGPSPDGGASDSGALRRLP
ncbi:MAG TPA: hypothetical protein VFQ80_14735 [Thermomicrobiales bacterium]|nr:hypothetical protein [Thermomicrobiales bacterium]